MYHMTFPSKRERVDVVLDRFDMVYHGFWITHVDALCHVGWDGELYNGRPFAESLTVEGALWCPIDPIFTRGITTRGVFLDVAAARKEGYVTVGRPVTPREHDEAGRRARVAPEPSDRVVRRRGVTPRLSSSRPLSLSSPPPPRPMARCAGACTSRWPPSGSTRPRPRRSAPRSWCSTRCTTRW